MFAPTYFTPGLFTPTYFAEAGSDAPAGAGPMFAPTYFPPPLFAPTYFGGGSPTPTPTPAGTLRDAIIAVVESSVAGLTRCFYLESSERSPAFPYAILNPIGEMPEWNTAGASYDAWSDFQLTIVGTNGAQIEGIRDDAYRLFTPRKDGGGGQANPVLTFADGKLPPCGCLPGLKRQFMQAGAAPKGGNLWFFSFDLKFYVTRSM